MLNDLILQFSVSFAPAPDGAPNSEGHTFVLLLFYAALFAIFYFLLIRPQTKKTKEVQDMQSGLKKGDTIVTSGGIYGVVYKIKEDVITVQIADGVRVKVQKAAIGEKLKESEKKSLDE